LSEESETFGMAPVWPSQQTVSSQPFVLSILRSYFLARDGLRAIYYRLSIRMSVRLSDGCIIEKRLKLGLWNSHRMAAPSL